MTHSRLSLLIGISLMTLSIAASAADAYSLVSGKFDSASRAHRQAVANDLLKRIDLLRSYLPIQKSSETAWIQRELADQDRIAGTNAASERFERLFMTPEYQHYLLNYHLEEIRNSLECIVRTEVNVKAEMVCWANASHQLTADAPMVASIPLLISNGRLPKDIAKKAKLAVTDSNYGSLYVLYGRGIIKHILLPYVQDKIR